MILKTKTTLNELLSELKNRLPSRWISEVPIPRRRLVWVEGRKDINVSLGMYKAAYALGITLVIIDNPGHWLEDNAGAYAYLREAFIPVRIAADEGFVERILSAVRAYDKPIDGVMTVSDARLQGVAEVCDILGLPTPPASAYAIAGDKAKTRMLEPDTSGAYAFESVAALEKQLGPGGLLDGLQYPVIVKPCIGWGSECISKVSNDKELVVAAQKASNRHANSPQRRADFLIERYVDGPEVDINFALQDGKVVFYEVADDYPSRGDFPDASAVDNFQETANLLPCGLPESELALVRDHVHQSILRMGFVNGTFHCEARIENSSMAFELKDRRLGDLYSTEKQNAPPKVYLHEINARPAGYLESVATNLTWGVDYYALQLVFSLGDMSRYSSLSEPFRNGPQWYLALLLVPEEGVGVMKTPDTVKDLMERHDDLREAIVDYNTAIKGGDRLFGPSASELSYLAYISVVSKKSRKECLRLANKTLEEFRYELE
ncbi:hypothetical protein JX265_001995 [Neoarthrinium moseri]|uniref:ATP-grasp domain-containing protein n=1 Tax=Neoarthrinium moseri TaxID=1658444 RepID=A0A9P9WW67_9PEZI|nr:hypothetical protein JX265_001995 [Neoarthrinium moseri]